jgi:hypothetical protein
MIRSYFSEKFVKRSVAGYETSLLAFTAGLQASRQSMIARCVAGLQDSAVVRHEFYWFARAELGVQLSVLTPPPTESEIICERLALDDAINKVEADRSPSVDASRYPLRSSR